MSNLMVALIETVGVLGTLILGLIFLALFIGSVVWIILDMKKHHQRGLALGLIVLICPPLLALGVYLLPRPLPFFLGLLTWPLALIIYAMSRSGTQAPASAPARPGAAPAKPPAAAPKPASKPARPARPTA